MRCSIDVSRARARSLMLVLSAVFGWTFAGASPCFGQTQDNDVAPSPPSIGADIPVTYFGPPPSSVRPELVGPLQLLKSGPIDLDQGTITLPLYHGQMVRGQREMVWFILTDTTDPGNAEALGLNFAPKLEYADVCRGVRTAYLEQDGTVSFETGTVDFAPERMVMPGASPAFFPPAAFQPGSVGDDDYTPLIRIENNGNFVYNAPVIAFDIDAEGLQTYEDGVPPEGYAFVHDKVVRISPEDQTVTLSLTPGFSFAKPVLYLSLDANDGMAAALEGATLAPGLQDVPVGRDDSAFSSVERLFAFANGPTNLPPDQIPSGLPLVNPQRQGFNSALAGEGGPLNVLGGIPTVATDYSPLWDLNVGEWTPTAIERGYRSRLFEEFQILGFVQRGFITGPGGAPYGSTGIIVNCPIVFRFL